MIHVLLMVNFEKAIKPTITVTQNLACFPLHSFLSRLSHTHTHTTGGRIDKQLGTMEIHKRHVEELWQNALNLAEHLKQVS